MLNALRLKVALRVPELSKWLLCLPRVEEEFDEAAAPDSVFRSLPLIPRSSESNCVLDSAESLSSEGIEFICLRMFGLNMVICTELQFALALYLLIVTICL